MMRTDEGRGPDSRDWMKLILAVCILAIVGATVFGSKASAVESDVPDVPPPVKEKVSIMKRFGGWAKDESRWFIPDKEDKDGIINQLSLEIAGQNKWKNAMLKEQEKDQDRYDRDIGNLMLELEAIKASAGRYAAAVKVLESDKASLKFIESGCYIPIGAASQ